MRAQAAASPARCRQRGRILVDFRDSDGDAFTGPRGSVASDAQTAHAAMVKEHRRYLFGEAAKADGSLLASASRSW
jgi:hypothetical protein